MAPPLSPSSVVKTVREGVGNLARGAKDRIEGAVTPGADPGEWLAVTALTDPETLRDGGLPAPLDAVRDRVQVEVGTAPAGKGTEISARIVPSGDDASDQDLHRRLRVALRESKSLLETGRVIRVDPQPAGRRGTTPAGAGIDSAQAHGREQGVL